MIIGHYAVALAAKRAAPRASLGVLITAATLPDLVFAVLLLLGVETVTPDPGGAAFMPLSFVSYPWSHSLLSSAVFGLLLGTGYFALSGYGAGAGAIMLLVPSHWLLDYIAHRPDLPLTPWTTRRHGLGLWDWVTGTIVLELAMFVAGVALYYSITRGRDPFGTFGSYVFVALCLGIFAYAVLGMPPTSAAAIAWIGMGQWLLIAMAVSIDRHRPPRR